MNVSSRFRSRGTWVAQLVKHLTSAQVMISRFLGSSPMSGSLLSAQSLLRILCLPLSVPPLLVLSLSLSKTNKHKRKTKILLEPELLNRDSGRMQPVGCRVPSRKGACESSKVCQDVLTLGKKERCVKFGSVMIAQSSEGKITLNCLKPKERECNE